MGSNPHLPPLTMEQIGVVSKNMVVAHTHAGCRSASAGFYGSAQRSPAHAGASSAAIVRMARHRLAMRIAFAWKLKDILYQISD